MLKRDFRSLCLTAAWGCDGFFVTGMEEMTEFRGGEEPSEVKVRENENENCICGKHGSEDSIGNVHTYF